jgi:hypothetical protein
MVLDFGHWCANCNSIARRAQVGLVPSSRVPECRAAPTVPCASQSVKPRRLHVQMHVPRSTYIAILILSAGGGAAWRAMLRPLSRLQP